MKKHLILGLLIIGSLINNLSTLANQNEEYAKCLQEKGVTMYGTSWCVHCKHQKELFGKYFSYVKFVDCDKSPLVCEKAGVSYYPTWLIESEDSSKRKEIQAGTIQEVAKAAGCK